MRPGEGGGPGGRHGWVVVGAEQSMTMVETVRFIPVEAGQFAWWWADLIGGSNTVGEVGQQ